MKQSSVAKTIITAPANNEVTSSATIFKQGSTTYFYSSIFFPNSIQNQVTDLYAFVRVADNYVDAVPQDKKGFLAFKKDYYKSHKSDTFSNNPIISNYQSLEQNSEFDPEWTQAFLDSMEMDLTKTSYKTFTELETYIYGSAEVIGLYLSRILDLPKEADNYAKMLGKAMQYINFIRDINEDIGLGRIYIPESELKKHGISRKDFTVEKLTGSLKHNFKALIHDQIEIFYAWQKEAEKGFKYIPRRFLIPIKTASEMYKYTAWRIYKNPEIVFQMKVKPSRKRIFARAILEFVTP